MWGYILALGLFSFPAFAQETFNMAAFAEFYECRRSLGNSCSLAIDGDANIAIKMMKVSDAPEVWKGSATRDHSQLGLEAVLEVSVQKEINRRVSEVPQWGVSARVRKKNGNVLIPWVSASFAGKASGMNGIAAHGPEYDNVTSDLAKAKLFLYIDNPLSRGNRFTESEP